MKINQYIRANRSAASGTRRSSSPGRTQWQQASKSSRPQRQERATKSDPPPGMVYAMTNEAPANKVIVLRRGRDGTLTQVTAVPTGGAGTGTRTVSAATPQTGVDPLASQGSLTLSRGGTILLAVNAGSDSISSFRVAADGSITLADTAPSGGAQPNSVDIFGTLVYVSNVGNAANAFSSNVSGFRVTREGKLTRIADSTRSLSTINAQPARVVFSPEGSLLAVSELTTNRVSVFRVGMDGMLSGPTVNESNGPGPFGSVFIPSGRLLVSEVGDNALSSYAVTLDGTMLVLSGSVPTTQRATCWVVATPDERFAYTSNADSGTITSYAIAKDGTLTVSEDVAAKLEGETPHPIDSGVSRDGRYFYVLDGGQGAVAAFRIEGDGRLTLVQTVTNVGLPALGAQGLAVR